MKTAELIANLKETITALNERCGSMREDFKNIEAALDGLGVTADVQTPEHGYLSYHRVGTDDKYRFSIAGREISKASRLEVFAAHKALPELIGKLHETFKGFLKDAEVSFQYKADDSGTSPDGAGTDSGTKRDGSS